MKSIDELTKKAEAGYAAGHTEVIDLVRYIAGDEDLPTRLVAGTIAARVIAKHKGDPVAPIVGTARDLADTAKENAADKLPDVPDVAGAVMNAVEFPTRMLKWLSEPESWERIAYVVGGGVLILIAAKLLVEGRVAGVVGKVAGVATSVAPTGKVAKVAGTAAKAAKAAG